MFARFLSSTGHKFAPVAAIVGSSNFTSAGPLSNKELNLTHRANLLPEEVSPERVKVAHSLGHQRLPQRSIPRLRPDARASSAQLIIHALYIEG